MNTLILIHCLWLAQAGAAPKPASPMPSLEDSQQKIALAESAPAGDVTAATAAKALETLAGQFALQGFNVISPAGVAAIYADKSLGTPVSGDDPSRLAEMARVAGAGYAASLTFVPTCTAFRLTITVVDVADASVVIATSGSVAFAREALFVDMVRKLAPGVAVSVLNRVAVHRPAPAAEKNPEPKPVDNKKPDKPDRGAKPAKPGKTPATAPPTPTPTPAPAPAEDASAAEVLLQARKAYDAMEYESAAMFAARALSMPGLEPEARLDAYLVKASSLAITADPQAAEVPFRLLLRARPDFDMPRSTPPRILGVFQKVKAEERAIGEQVRSVGRKRLIDGLQLLSEPPRLARGGRVLPFAFRLRDPTAAVSAFDVPYRREGDAAYSVLALKRDAEGSWRGTIPAEWTASEKPYAVEYYLSTHDDGGPLLTRGEPTRPLRLEMSAGTVERVKPLPRWSFWTGVAVTGVAAVAAGGLGIATFNAQSDYNTYARSEPHGFIDGALLKSKAQTGRSLAQASLGVAITAAVLAVVTAVILPFSRGAEEPDAQQQPGSAP